MSTEKQRRAAARRKLERQIARREELQRQRNSRMAWMWGVAGLLVIALVIFLVVVNTKDEPDTEAGGDEPVGCEYTEDGETAPIGTPPVDDVPTSGTVEIAVTTDQGTMSFTLDRELAPCAVNSFEFLAQGGFYDNTMCHRLTTEASGFGVLQCGDPTASGQGGPGYYYNEEPPSGEDPYPEGTLAMANAGPGSTGSQFFICYTSCSVLPPDYSAVGSVTEGLDVAKTVAAAGVAGGGSDGTPAQPITITSMVIGEPAAGEAA